MVHQNQQQETAAVVLHAEVKMIHCIKGTVFHPEHTVKDFQSVHMSHYTPHIHNKFILVTSCCQKQIQKIHLTCFQTNCLVTALLKVIPHLTSGPYKPIPWSRLLVKIDQSKLHIWTNQCYIDILQYKYIFIYVYHVTVEPDLEYMLYKKKRNNKKND